MSHPTFPSELLIASILGQSLAILQVLKYLSESTLGNKGPSPEKHLAELQKLVCVWDKDVKAALEQVKNYTQGKGKAADAKGDAWVSRQVSTIAQLMKSQFVPAQVSL
jgi:hypothetical protein